MQGAVKGSQPVPRVPADRRDMCARHLPVDEQGGDLGHIHEGGAGCHRGLFVRVRARKYRAAELASVQHARLGVPEHGGLCDRRGDHAGARAGDPRLLRRGRLVS